MKVLALMMFFSLPVPRLAAPVPQLAAPASASAAHPHGKWYLAESGHAVYCYGPVKIVNDPITGMQRVATFCKGNQLVVPLKD